MILVNGWMSKWVDVRVFCVKLPRRCRAVRVLGVLRFYGCGTGVRAIKENLQALAATANRQYCLQQQSMVNLVWLGKMGKVKSV